VDLLCFGVFNRFGFVFQNINASFIKTMRDCGFAKTNDALQKNFTLRKRISTKWSLGRQQLLALQYQEVGIDSGERQSSLQIASFFGTATTVAAIALACTSCITSHGHV
jgi:hypothetical protein